MKYAFIALTLLAPLPANAMMCMAGDGSTYTVPGNCPLIAPRSAHSEPTPQLAPNGQYVGGHGPVTLCPDGSYVSGQCVLAPNGQYVGADRPER
jgi:hypothetical protein